MEGTDYYAHDQFAMALAFLGRFEESIAESVPDMYKEALDWLDRYLGPVRVE